ncbi:MAG TPA: DUF6632 domain-containing protein [Terriglobales bacterium]
MRIALTVVGVLFLAMVLPMVLFFRAEPALSMMMSVYATLGLFVLISVRNPPAHRGLIAFTAWSSLAHAVLMGAQAQMKIVAPVEMIGSVVLAVIGVALLALRPRSVDVSARAAF